MTASIPTHRLFVHVRRLVAKGYKVSFGFNLWEKGLKSLLGEGGVSKVEAGNWFWNWGILGKLKFVIIIRTLFS